MKKRIKVFFLLMSAGSAVYNLFLPLVPDEAYYWAWSRNLQLSYFDHPPLIAYLIRLFTLFSNQEFFIRLIAVLSVSLAAYIIYRLADDMFGRGVAEKSLVIFLLMPLTQAGYIVVTPDSPLILCWALMVYLFYKYLTTSGKEFLYLTGLTGGLLLLAKYTGILLPAALFLFVLFSEHRKLLIKRETYLAAGLIILLLLPVLIWNYQHDWISFKFQFSHGVAQEKNFAPGLLGEFIGGQLIAFNPVFFLLLGYMLIVNFKELITDRFLYYLAWPFLGTFLFFLYQGVFKSSEVNWPAPAYITAVIILAYWIDKYKMEKLYKTGIIIAVILIIIIRFPVLIPGFPAEGALIRRFMGYEQIFSRAGEYITGDEIILSDSYQNASEASYYLKDQPRVYIITEARFSSYNYWSAGIKRKIENGKIKKAVFIGERRPVEQLKRYFSEVNPVRVLHYRGRFIDREYYLYRCRN